MSHNAVETVMGAVVLVVAAVFLFFAYTATQVHASGGYQLTARFTRVEGLRNGGDVRISGIKVGSVVSQTLDPKTFDAVVTISVDPAIKLPVDTTAQVASNGLLGDKYLSLEPGNQDEIIKAGGTIDHTQPSMSLESLIGQYIFSQGQGQSPPAAAAKPGAGAAPAAPAGQK